MDIFFRILWTIFALLLVSPVIFIGYYFLAYIIGAWAGWIFVGWFVLIAISGSDGLDIKETITITRNGKSKTYKED